MSIIDNLKSKTTQIGNSSSKIKCPNCGALLEGDSDFCCECGSSIKKQPEANKDFVFCSNCGNKVAAGVRFCSGCGSPMDGVSVPAVPQKKFSGPSLTKINNFFDNGNIKCIDEKGLFRIFEHQHDLSVDANFAQTAYFMEKMNVKKRQVLCKLDNSSVKVQAGAMQWMSGNIEMDSGIEGTKDFFKKLGKSMVTNESVAKPIYNGTGYVMLEPTYHHLFIVDISEWGSGIVLDDGLFLACESHITESINKRSNVSTALLGGEGLFNLTLHGDGYCVLESPVPYQELIEFELTNDVLKIDGNMAIAWSESLEFTVENSTKSILGSVASGEGIVNVYRGTGKVLLAPTMNGTVKTNPANGPQQTTASSSDGLVGSIVGSLLG